MRNPLTSPRAAQAALGFLVLLLSSRGAPAQIPDFQRMTPEERAAYRARLRAAAQQDRERMMRLLGVREPDSLPPPEEDPNRPLQTTRRPGSNNWYDAAGNPVIRSSWGTWSNYDEAKAGPYTLPDPLVLKDGRRVTTPEMWWNLRRPEILEDFSSEVYGRIPENTPEVRFEVAGVDSAAFGGRAIVKRVVGRIDNSAYPAASPRIEITMYLPPKAAPRVPIVVRVGGFFGGSPDQLPDAVRQVLALGWAFATFNTGALQMDSGAGLGEGIIGLVNRGQPRKADDWGVLAAWSWGLSRVLDYLEADPAVDATRAAIQGHSRWGKTALLAAALDQRWAAVFASCSGAMGASLEKRNWGETIDHVAGVDEYHWMAGNFLKYAGRWAEMPVDAHQLIALIAPRPVFITGGTQDQWADPHGEFLAVVAAEPVYRLLGKRGPGTTEMPAPDVALIDGELAFRNHDGGHVDAPDWPIFLEFARRYLEAPGARAQS